MTTAIHTKAAMFRCALAGRGILLGDGSVTFDPHAGEPSLMRNLLVALGYTIVPVLSLARELQSSGVPIRGDHEFGAVGAAAIAKGDVVDEHVET